MSTQHDSYVELVLRCVESVPAGRVTTYGAVADVLRDVTGGGGPRQVARVMALEGAAVPWWRCVRADGSLPERIAGRARVEHLVEGTALRRDGRVDVGTAFVTPAFVTPAFVTPAFVTPAFVTPAFVTPAFVTPVVEAPDGVQ